MLAILGSEPIHRGCWCPSTAKNYSLPSNCKALICTCYWPCHINELLVFFHLRYPFQTWATCCSFLAAQDLSIVWWGVWSFPSNLGPPSNSGLQRLPFQPLNISVQKVWTPPYSKNNPAIWPSTFIYFFTNPPLLARLFHQCCPNEIPDKHKNKLMWENYFFIFKRLKNYVKCFF